MPKMRTARACVALVVVFSALALSAPPPQARFDDVLARIRAAVADGRAPSMAVAVGRRGDVVVAEAFGFADKAKKVPASPSIPYPVASLTKTFTATAVMVLTERGRLSLDEPISRYLGAINRPGVQAAPEVTVRRTLGNVAGFPVHNQWFYADRPERPLPFADTMRCYGTGVNRPGRRYLYSNLGYGVIGEVVSRASGRPFRDVLTREVFEPLGLTTARVAERPEDVRDAVTSYGTDGEALPFLISDHPAASDVYISVRDLARFGLFHAGSLESGRSVIGLESRTAMQQAGLGNYALGWLVNPDWHGRRVIWNSGARPGASAALWIAPSEGVVVALVANQIGAPVNQFAGEVLASVLGVELPTAPAAASAAPAPSKAPVAQKPSALTGRWRGSLSTCPDATAFTLDIRGHSEIRGTIGTASSQAIQTATASDDSASGTLSHGGEGAQSTFQFDLELAGDGRLEGLVIRRTSLGPRGNNVVTFWAVLTRQE